MSHAKYAVETFVLIHFIVWSFCLLLFCYNFSYHRRLHFNKTKTTPTRLSPIFFNHTNNLSLFPVFSISFLPRSCDWLYYLQAMNGSIHRLSALEKQTIKRQTDWLTDGKRDALVIRDKVFVFFFLGMNTFLGVLYNKKTYIFVNMKSCNKDESFLYSRFLYVRFA